MLSLIYLWVFRTTFSTLMNIKSSNHLDKFIKVRLSDRDYESLLKIKRKTHLSFSDIIRTQLKPIL